MSYTDLAAVLIVCISCLTGLHAILDYKLTREHMLIMHRPKPGRPKKGPSWLTSSTDQ